jgi:hypothetical protein
LLDLLQDLLISSLAVTEAFLDGLLSLGAALSSFLFDPSTGFLTQPLDIPILSDLYEWLFGSQLTFFDLLVLVVSIPVTFLYRIIEGEWLSDQTLSGAQADLTPLARAVGLINGSLFFGRTIFTPLADIASMNDAPNPVLFKIVTAITATFVLTSLLKTPLLTADWIIVAVRMGFGFAPFLGPAAPAITSFLALARTGAYIFEKADPAINTPWLVFSASILGTLPPFAQPIKYLNNDFPELAVALMVSVDYYGNVGAAAATILNTGTQWGAEPTGEPPVPEPAAPARLFMPYAPS